MSLGFVERQARALHKMFPHNDLAIYDKMLEDFFKQKVKIS